MRTNPRKIFLEVRLCDMDFAMTKAAYARKLSTMYGDDFKET
jgi:hypothetical protein